MSYPYWPNGSVVGYQQLAYNSTSQVLTLAPGGNSVTLNGSGGSGSITSSITTGTIRTSTINAYQGGLGNYGVYVSTSATGPAQIRAESGNFAEIKAVGVNGEVGFVKGNTEKALMGTNAGNMLVSVLNESPGDSILDLVSYNSGTYNSRTRLNHEGTSNSLILTTVAGGDVAGIRMSDVGGGDLFAFPNMSTITAQAQTFVGAQQTGLNTQHQTLLFNGNTIDVANLMPMATIYNSGTIEFGAGSGIAHYGTMKPGSNYMTIPATTYSGATNVVLAPYTSFTLYTGPSASGGSTVYENEGNPYFSTFTAQPYLNGNTFNSYTMFMGN